MNFIELLQYAGLGMLLALPVWPLLRRAWSSRTGRRLRRQFPGSGWQPRLIKPHRP